MADNAREKEFFNRDQRTIVMRWSITQKLLFSQLRKAKTIVKLYNFSLRLLCVIFFNSFLILMAHHDNDAVNGDVRQCWRKPKCFKIIKSISICYQY
jgi:hypothetical protein